MYIASSLLIEDFYAEVGQQHQHQHSASETAAADKLAQELDSLRLENEKLRNQLEAQSNFPISNIPSVSCMPGEYKHEISSIMAFNS